MIWGLIGAVGFSLLITATVAYDRDVSEWLGVLGAIIALGALVGGMLS